MRGPSSQVRSRRLIEKSRVLAAGVALGAMLISCASAPERADRATEDLMVAREAYDAARARQTREFMERLLDRVDRAAQASVTAGQATKPPTIDVLIISGGGDWGAFGAGVLKGWGRVQGELARPTFDVVTGVSTGALIAPFAFLGDDESYDRIVQLYRHPQDDWAMSRGTFFFLPNNPSFFSLPGLEREMRTALDRPMLERIAAE